MKLMPTQWNVQHRLAFAFFEGSRNHLVEVVHCQQVECESVHSPVDQFERLLETGYSTLELVEVELVEWAVEEEPPHLEEVQVG